MEKQKEQEQQIQEGITPQLAAQLLQLLKDNKKQVKHGTLNAILQYTSNKQQKQLFHKPQFYSQILKCINTPELTKICLSTLIHFSSDPIGDQQKFGQSFVKFIQPLTIELKNWKQKQEQLCLLFFFNISKLSQCSLKFIGQGDTQGYYIQILYAKMEQKSQLRWMIANIFANISSIEQGRKYISKQNIHFRFIQFLLDKQERVRIPVLKMLRNMSFLWEDEEFIKQILAQKHFFLDKIAQNIAVTLLKSQTLKNQQENIKKLVLKYGITQEKIKVIQVTKQNGLLSMQIAIDIFLILSNSNFPQRKPSIKLNELKDLISFLKFTDIEQATKDKLDALETFCFW